MIFSFLKNKINETKREVSGGYGKCLKCENIKKDMEFWNKVKNGMPYVCENVYMKLAGNKGFGVFAKVNIEKNQPIEYCYSLVLSLPSKEQKDTKIRQYAYTHRIGDNIEEKIDIIPFGFGEIYNSSERKQDANANYFSYPEQNLVVFRALKNIKKDEEILVWWGENYFNHWIKNK